MNAASIVEILNVPSEIVRTAVPTQASSQPPQTFKESLLAASKAPVSSRPTNETSSASRQTQQPLPAEAKLPPAARPVRDVPSLVLSPQTVQTQDSLPQQPPLIRSTIIPTQLALAKPVLTASDRVFHSAAAKLTDREVAKPESIKPNHSSSGITPQPLAPALPSVTLVSQVVPTPSNAVTNVVQDSVATGVPHPSSAVVPKTDARGATTIPSLPSAITPIVIPDAVRGVAADAVPVKAPSALPDETAPSADQGKVTAPAPKLVANVVPSPLPSAGPGAVTIPAPTVVAGAVPSPLATAVPEVVVSPAPKPVASTVSSAAPATVAKTSAPAVSDDAPRTVPTVVPGLVEKAAPPVVPISVASLPPAPASVLHAAENPSVRQEAAPKVSAASTAKTAAPAASPTAGGVATGLSAPGVAVDPPAAASQPVTAKSASILAAANLTAANGKDAANKAEADATGLKQHASDQQGLQTASEGTASAGDQSQSQGQGGSTQQDQSGTSVAAAVPPPQTFVNHALAAGVDRAQNAVDVASPLQAAAMLTGPADHTAKAPQTAAAAASALPQPTPIINTAKLIQSIGQTDMRVGMRSNEFGNISINTSATRDLISAQISLDHSELARTLAAHVPEMQARFGGNQAMDVRIDMNGQATGQGMGTSAGMSEGAGEGSRGDRQQNGNSGSSHPAAGFAQESPAAAAAMPAGEVKLNTRLDIRA